MNDAIIKGKYKLIREIGKGSYARVYLVEDTENGIKYALKRIDIRVLQESDYLIKAFKKELEIMKICECEYSAKLIDNFQTTNYQNIVMELCDGDLDSILRTKKDGFSEEEVKLIITQLNVVFKIMNKENILHRDLKLKNILYINEKTNPNIQVNPNQEMNKSLNLSEEFDKENFNLISNGFNVKLTDFGFSKIVDDNDITRTKLGSPSTMAPEIISNAKGGYNNKVDLWSIGVILYQLLFKKLPIQGSREEELYKNILLKKPIIFPSNKVISKECMDLLIKLLQFDPKDRIDWTSYFDHEFFKKVESVDEEDYIDKYYSNFRKLSDDAHDFPLNKAKNKATGEFVFIKSIDKKKLENSNNRAIFDKEIELMRTIVTENSIKFIELTENKKNFYIITECFDGKCLDNFIRNRKTISEAFLKKILRQLSIVFKELESKKIVLESISLKSFWFKSFHNEDNFIIKFFDYGLSSLFVETNYLRSFNLLSKPSEKTNIMSIGLIIYNLIFGENLYNFSEKENAEESIKNVQASKIKLAKPISSQLKTLLIYTIHTNPEKRYSWNKLLTDSFLKIQYCEDIKTKPSNLENKHFILDHQFERFYELFIQKNEMLLKFYQEIFERGIDSIENLRNKKFRKEAIIFLFFTLLEISKFRDIFQRKLQKNIDNPQIIDLRFYSFLNPKNFSICSFNLDNTLSNNAGKLMNFENPVLDSFDSKLIEIETNLSKIYKNQKEQIDEPSFSSKKEKNISLEKFFVKLAKSALCNYNKDDYTLSLKEASISKYFAEIILSIKLNNQVNKIKSLNQDEFSKYFQDFTNQSDINESMFETKNLSSLNEESIFFSFINSEISNFQSDKTLIPEEYNHHLIEKYIDFYLEIRKMIKSCEKKEFIRDQ